MIRRGRLAEQEVVHDEVVQPPVGRLHHLTLRGGIRLPPLARRAAVLVMLGRSGAGGACQRNDDEGDDEVSHSSFSSTLRSVADE